MTRSALESPPEAPDACWSVPPAAELLELRGLEQAATVEAVVATAAIVRKDRRVGATRILLRIGSISGELPAWHHNLIGHCNECKK